MIFPHAVAAVLAIGATVLVTVGGTGVAVAGASVAVFVPVATEILVAVGGTAVGGSGVLVGDMGVAVAGTTAGLTDQSPA